MENQHTTQAGLIADTLYFTKFRYQNEKELQRGIAEVLQKHGLAYKAEVQLTGKDRIDFLVGNIGIEVKVGGSLSAVTRQLYRYAERPEISDLILVTTRHGHGNLPSEINGKPLYVVFLINSFL